MFGKNKGVKKLSKSEQKQLEQDRENCLREMQPIMAKYNLEIVGRLVMANNGIIATAIFARPAPPESPPAPVPAGATNPNPDVSMVEVKPGDKQ